MVVVLDALSTAAAAAAASGAWSVPVCLPLHASPMIEKGTHSRRAKIRENLLQGLILAPSSQNAKEITASQGSG